MKTKKELLDDIYKELEDRRCRNAIMLGNIPDAELKLIKGHLLIEEVLYALLRNRMKKPKALDKARLSFAQILVLVEGLYYEKDLEYQWLYRATEKLNKIRNRLAHNVEPNNIVEQIEEFSGYVVKQLASDGFIPKDKLLYSLGSIHLNFATILALDKKFSLLPEVMQTMSFSSKVTASKLIAKGSLDNA